MNPSALVSHPQPGEPDGAREARVPEPEPGRTGRWVDVATVSTEPPVAHARFLHVVEQGARLSRVGSRLRVTKEKACLLEVSTLKLQGVLVYGNVQVSTQCLKSLLSEGVWLSFFTRNGVYRGRLQPPAERGGALRRLQWLRAADPDFCFQFASTIVRAKLRAQRLVASAFARNYPELALKRAHSRLAEAVEAVEQAANLEALRGIEGSGAKAYFELFRAWNRSELPFDHREKHGATDPINALLNFGYTLLTRELEGLLEGAGLDPAVGFYHAPDGDRPSLACDWVEEFRHLIVDRLVLTLVNRRTIQQDAFEPPDDRRGLRLKPEALRKFVAAYEQTLSSDSVSTDARGGGSPPVRWRTVMLAQLGSLLDSIADRVPYTCHLDVQG